MLRWLQKLESVRVAESREEREAVYRFRYTIYYEEFGRQLGNPDHERRWVTDPDDEKDYSTILYTGTLDDITGTVRLRHWAPDRVPQHEIDELSIDVFPDYRQRYTGEIGRLMIRPGMRGKLLLASMVFKSYELFCGEFGTELVFCYCSPGLVPLYRKLGSRPFRGRMVHAPDGVMVPLVNVLSDLAYYRRVGSPLGSVVRRYFGPGKRPAVDLEPYRGLLESDSLPVETDAERIWSELQETLSDAVEPIRFVDGLPEPVVRKLTEEGFIIRVTADTLLTRKGFGEEELYLILDGLFEARDGDRLLRLMARGELFGELAFFLPEHRRTATVSAVTDGQLLVLRGKSLRRLIERDPTAAAQLLLGIGRAMAERLVEATGTGPGSDQPEEAADDEPGASG